jgi:hypothetical protein
MVLQQPGQGQQLGLEQLLAYRQLVAGLEQLLAYRQLVAGLEQLLAYLVPEHHQELAYSLPLQS